MNALYGPFISALMYNKDRKEDNSHVVRLEPCVRCGSRRYYGGTYIDMGKWGKQLVCTHCLGDIASTVGEVFGERLGWKFRTEGEE